MSMRRGAISTYKTGADLIVEWRIADFSTLRKADGTWYWSPTFSFGGETWCLKIYQNGWSWNGTQHVHLCLEKYLSGRSIRVTFSLSLKTAKGEKYKEEHVTRDFHDVKCLHSFNPFISRAELGWLRSELLPDDVLTVVCTMRRSTPGGNERNDTERVNVRASTQRVRASAQTVEVSTQTVEVTTETVEASIQTVQGKCEACASRSPICPYDEELLQDFKELFLSKEDCDVILKVKDSEFPALRAILKARSPVFASTFRHDMKESSTGIVEIEDCDPSSFSDFLCYLYCGDTTLISRENVFGLFMAADKYQVSNLRAKCLEFMKRNLSVNTFCETLTLAMRHSEPELIRLCTDYFKQNVPKIIVTVKWQIFLAENPTESNELLIKSFVPNTS